MQENALIKVDKTFLEDLLRNLREGEYRQGREELYNESNDTYCCLGVACMVTGNFDKDDLNEIGTPSDLKYNISNCADLLPVNKFEDKDKYSKLEDVLISLNDGDVAIKNITYITYFQLPKSIDPEQVGCNFNQIADFIQLNTVGIEWDI